MKNQQTQLSKDIKKINQRIADFTRQGYQHSEEYGHLVNQLTFNDLKVGTTKSGNVKIVNQKYNEQQSAYISKIANGNLTVGKHKKRISNLIKEDLKKTNQNIFPNTKQKREYVNNFLKQNIKKVSEKVSQIHDFIEEHKGDIYKLSDMTEMVRRGEKLELHEVDELLSMYDDRKEELKKADKNLEKLWGEWVE